MAMNPQMSPMGISPEILTGIVSDPRSSPQQRMAALTALNGMKGPQMSPAPLPQMQGDSTGISTLHPAFAAAVRDEVAGGGSGGGEEPASPATSALMAGAADANRVAGANRAMAKGGAVRGYDEGGPVAAPDAGEDDDPHGYLRIIRNQLDSGKGGGGADDKWLALLQASLGTMASASRPGATFLGSIGEGGLQGLQGFRQAQAMRAEERMKNAALAGNLLTHDEAIQARKEALAQQAYEAALRRKADKDKADADRASREGIASEGNLTRATIAQGNQAISAALAAAAAERAAAATANAPTGVVPPTEDQAKAAGIPFAGVPNPYANVSKKAAEELYKTNERIFENNQVKQALVEGKNAELRTDLKRFSELNEMGITGPSNAIPGVGGTKKFFSPELQEAASISDRLVPTMRQGLPGSASDLDVKMFRGAGPEITKDKDANANRIAALTIALDNADDKAQFERDFFAVHHHMQGANKAWREYLQANPIFDHTKGAKLYSLNPNRKTYREYFGGDAAPSLENSVLNKGAAATITPAGAAVPAPGGGDGKVVVRKGADIVRIPAADLDAAKKDGYEVIP